MESIGVGPWIAIVVAVGAIGVLVGYWLGTKMGGHNTEPMRELHREQKAYKDDVREHFEQVSATMTRMVEDYREMYNHVAKGAEKLADMHHETVIEPPPKPEAITQDHHADDESDTSSASEASGTQKSTASSDKPAPSATAPTASGAAAKSSASSSASPKASAATADKASGGTHDASKPADDGQSPAKSSDDSVSSTERPQDAAIRAAAEDAATPKR